MKILAKIIASGLGTGYSPVAPGTTGSALAAVIVYLARDIWTAPLAIVASAAAYFIGVAVCNIAEKDWGHDNGRMVIDEIAGMFLSAAFVGNSILLVVAAFFAFRLFDITKPPPARQAENLRSGWGVMTDDMVAGFYAAIVIYGVKIWIS